jgi:hypothetical protein
VRQSGQWGSQPERYALLTIGTTKLFAEPDTA